MTAGIIMERLHQKTNTPMTIKFLFGFAAVFSLFFHFTMERSQRFTDVYEIGVMVFLLKLSIKAMFGMAHYCCVELFPALMRAKAFSITNTTARSFQVAGPMVVEYMKNIALLISVLSFASFFSPFLMEPPDYHLQSKKEEEQEN